MLWLNYSKKSRCFLKIWVSTEKTFILKRTARSGAVQFVVWLDSWQAGDASLGCLSLSLIRWSIPVPIVSPSFFTPGGQPREDSLNFPAIFTHNAVFFFFFGTFTLTSYFTLTRSPSETWTYKAASVSPLVVEVCNRAGRHWMHRGSWPKAGVLWS